MMAGFALLEMGTVQSRNVKHTMLRTILSVSLAFIIWYLVGYVSHSIFPHRRAFLSLKHNSTIILFVQKDPQPFVVLVLRTYLCTLMYACSCACLVMEAAMPTSSCWQSLLNESDKKKDKKNPKIGLTLSRLRTCFIALLHVAETHDYNIVTFIHIDLYMFSRIGVHLHAFIHKEAHTCIHFQRSWHHVHECTSMHSCVRFINAHMCIHFQWSYIWIHVHAFIRTIHECTHILQWTCIWVHIHAVTYKLIHSCTYIYFQCSCIRISIHAHVRCICWIACKHGRQSSYGVHVKYRVYT
jgi:hypothetical protein